MVSCAVLCRKEGFSDYLREICENFALVTVIPASIHERKAKCEVFNNGELVKTFSLINLPKSLRKPSKYIPYFVYMISIVQATILMRRKFDYFIGEGHHYSLIGVLLKKLGVVSKVIYLSGDYFENILSFQAVDRYLAYRVDAIWNASPQMAVERKKRESKPDISQPKRKKSVAGANLCL